MNRRNFSPVLQASSLESFCRDSSSLRTKIALLTFYKIKFPIWAEKFILIFEYLQLLSLAALASSLLYENSDQNIFIFEAVTYTLKLINPSFLLDYKRNSMTSTILVLVFCFTLFKLLLFANAVYTSKKDKEMNSWLLFLWRWIYKFQTRIFYGLLTSFWVRTMIETQDNGLSLLGMGKIPIIFASIVMIGIEFLFSLMLETQLGYFLPTKNFLSAKNSQLQMITFLQKFIIQGILSIFRSNSGALNWMIPIVGIIIDMKRFYEFFFKLPLYHTNALILQGRLHSVMFALNLANLVNITLQQADYTTTSTHFMIITWILLSLFTNKISYQVLKSQIVTLVSTQNHFKSAELLLHKVSLTKELHRYERLPASDISNNTLKNLILLNQNINFEEIFDLKNLQEQFPELLPSFQDLPDETMNKIFLLYYQELSKKYPKNSLIKLHIAHRSLKNAESYPKVIKMAHGIQKQKWSKNYLGSSLLLHDIEKSILNNVQKQTKEQSLDFLAYIQSAILLAGLRKNMLEQTNLHIKICENMLYDPCDLEEIHHSAQHLSSLKILIQKKIDKLSQDLSEYYISPFLLYAEYSLIANYSKENFEKYHEIYIKRYHKTQQAFQELTLREENLYQETNALLLISTQKNEYGKILYCSPSLAELCGGKSVSIYQGLNISTLFPLVLKEFYENMFRLNNDFHEDLMNRIHHAYLYNKDRHLVEVDFCFKYHPCLTQGLCLSLLIRPTPVSESSEFLLLSHDGQIEGGSKELSEFLRLNKISSQTTISIKDLSEELFTMNNSFNLILKKKKEDRENELSQSPQKKWLSRFMRAKSILNGPDLNIFETELLYEQAETVYYNFTSEGQEVQLRCYRKNSQDRESYKFHAIVQVLNYGGIKMKLVNLRRAGHDKKIKNLKDTPAEDIDNIEENCDPIFTDYRERESTNFPILTTPSHAELLPSENRNLITGETETYSPRRIPRKIPFFSKGNHKMSLQNSSVPFSESSQVNHFEMSYLKKKNPKYITTQSSIGRRVAEKSENKIYTLAILSKSYPKSFVSLSFIFYLVILLTFAGQIIMKSVSDSTMEDLQIKKTLLKDSEEKNYKGTLIEITGRGIMISNAFLLQNAAAFPNHAQTVENLRTRSEDMRKVNDRMLRYMHTLKKDVQEKMFNKSVRVNGTYLDSWDQTYKYVDMFQIVIEIASAIRALIGSDDQGLLQYHIGNYLRQNLVNDFLYESLEIANLLTEAVEEQKESLQEITDLFLTLNPLLLSGIGILLCSIIWNQYRIEKGNMKAFVKLPSEGVKTIADKLAHFQKSLVVEDNFEKKWFARTHQDLQSLYKREHTQGYSRMAETKQIKYDAFRKRYYKYITTVVLCISCLVAITIWDFITTHQAIKIIYNKQNQLQFANFISNRATITHTTFVECFFTNNTQMVGRKDSFQGMLDLFQVLQDIQAQIPYKFLEVDGTYNPEVRDLIFKNNPECKGFKGSFLTYCTTLLAKGQAVNMAAAIASLIDVIDLKIQDFLKVNRTLQTYINDAVYWHETPLTYTIMISEEAHKIADIQDARMTEKITEMHDLKVTIITVFSISLMIVSLITWFYILKVIREVHNNFKKVLQTFPPSLVLSSYLLKKFLQATSIGHLLKKNKGRFWQNVVED